MLALAGPLRPLASADHPLHETARQRNRRPGRRAAKVLGIPGMLAVSLRTAKARTTPGPLLSLTVNARSAGRVEKRW